jgi:hypothetical protein
MPAQSRRRVSSQGFESSWPDQAALEEVVAGPLEWLQRVCSGRQDLRRPAQVTTTSVPVWWFLQARVTSNRCCLQCNTMNLHGQ